MRYVAIHKPVRASDSWEDQPPIAAATTVYESEEGPIDTGLIDVTGTKLYRVKDRVKMGYL